ncbi:MAG: hypothetical protein ABIO72_01840 [Patescibacteria group bacterium]
MSRLRPAILFGVLIAVATPVTVFAAFAGPSQSPPQGNVSGVVWNRTAADENNSQSGAEYNVAGSGRVGGDFFLGDSKALRIDSTGDTWLNIGNWKNGKFTLNVVGNIQTDTSDGAEGSITADKYCIGASCISSWPVGGGGGGAGTITGVTAGTGIVGGGTTGNVNISFDPAYGDGRYLQLSGGTLSGGLTLAANPTTNLQAATKQYVDNAVGAAGGGTITGVTAGTGLEGGGTVGTVAVGLDPAHQSGAAYDGRFVNLDGDAMTGSLYSPEYTGKEFKIDNGVGDVIQTQAYQSFGQKGTLELLNHAGQKMRFMNGDGSLIYSNNGSSFPPFYLNFSRGDGLALKGLSATYGLLTTDAVGALGSAPGGPYHTQVSLSEYGGPNFHTGVASYAATQLAKAGSFTNNWNGSSRGAVLGTGTNAAEFTGNVCINGDCRGAWPGAAAVTQINTGVGLLGGPITSNGTITFDTTFGDGRYINVNGDSMSDSLTINAPSTPIALVTTGQGVGGNFTGGTNGLNAYGGTTAGYFQNSADSSYRAWVGYNGYGGYFAAPAAGIALYSSGLTQLSGNTTITGSATVSGEITATANTLASCAWTGYIADGSAVQCPAATPIMSGMQRSGTTMRAYCCDL